jgi:hypothetical protein
LVISQTKGFEHDSIPDGMAAIYNMHTVITMQVVGLDRRPVTDRISPAALFPERVEPLRPRRGNAECFGCVGVVG